MKFQSTLTLAILILNPLFVSANESSSCIEAKAPVTSVADFDANGIVNGKDIAILAKKIGKKRRARSHHSGDHHENNRFNSKRSSRSNHENNRSNSRRSSRSNYENNWSNSKRSSRSNADKAAYSPLYDRNNDGVLDNIDVFLATRDMGKSSTVADQELAKISNAILAGTYVCVEPQEAVIDEPVVEVTAPVTVSAPITISW